MATFTTKQRTNGLLKKLALATALSACSLAQADVLTFEQERDSPVIFSGDISTFGDYYVQSFSGVPETPLAGLIVDGATQADICFEPLACPVNNASKYYAGLDDGYFYFGKNNGSNFRVNSLRASFIGASAAGSYLPTSGYLVLQGFGAMGNLIGAASLIPLFSPNAQNQFTFSTYNLGLFTNNVVSEVRVLGYACSAAGCLRTTTLANFAIDDIDTTTVPEPATLGLIGLGLFGLGAFSRKRKQ